MDFSKEELECLYDELSKATEELSSFFKKMEISEIVRNGSEGKLLQAVFDSGFSVKLSCIKFLALLHEFWGVKFKQPSIDNLEISADIFLFFNKIRKEIKKNFKQRYDLDLDEAVGEEDEKEDQDKENE